MDWLVKMFNTVYNIWKGVFFDDINDNFNVLGRWFILFPFSFVLVIVTIVFMKKSHWDVGGEI